MRTLTLNFMLDMLGITELTHDVNVETHEFVEKDKVESKIDKAAITGVTYLCDGIGFVMNGSRVSVYCTEEVAFDEMLRVTMRSDLRLQPLNGKCSVYSVDCKKNIIINGLSGISISECLCNELIICKCNISINGYYSETSSISGIELGLKCNKVKISDSTIKIGNGCEVVPNERIEADEVIFENCVIGAVDGCIGTTYELIDCSKIKKLTLSNCHIDEIDIGSILYNSNNTDIVINGCTFGSAVCNLEYSIDVHGVDSIRQIYLGELDRVKIVRLRGSTKVICFGEFCNDTGMEVARFRKSSKVGYKAKSVTLSNNKYASVKIKNAIESM